MAQMGIRNLLGSIHNATKGIKRAKVIFVPAPASQATRVGLFVSAGSADDPLSGLAHMVEHIAYDQHFRSEWPSRPFGELNALTTSFWTAFLWEGSATDLEAVIQRFSSLHQMCAKPAVVEHQRKILALEIEQRLTSDPVLAARMSLHDVVFAGTGLDNPSLGRYESIVELTVDHVLNFQELYYTLDRCVIVVAASEATIRRHAAKSQILDTGDPVAALPTLAGLLIPQGGTAQSGMAQHVVDHEQGRHLIFAALGSGTVGGAEALINISFLKSFLVRAVPQSLIMRLRSLGIARASINIHCELTRQAQPAITGTIELRSNNEVDLVQESVRDALVDLAQCRIEPTLACALRAQLKNNSIPHWKTDGLIGLGGSIATLGPNAALDAMSRSISDIDPLPPAFMRNFEGMTVNKLERTV